MIDSTDVLSADYDPAQVREYSVTEEEYRGRMAEISGSSYPDFIDPDTDHAADGPSSYSAASIGGALQSGLDKLNDAFSKTVTGSVGLTLGLIPWWVKFAVVFYLVLLTFPIWGTILGVIGVRAIVKK